MKKRIFLFSVLPLLAACEGIKLETADTNVPVIECYLHPGNNVSLSVKKQLVFNSGDTAVQYIDDLEVMISDGTNTCLLENTSSGTYENPSFELAEDVEYSLEFAYNNKTVTAVTETPAKPSGFSASATSIEVFSMDDFVPGSGTFPEMSDPVTLAYENPDNEYHMIVVECTEENPELINTDTDRPTRAFRSMPVTGTSQELNPRQFIYYGTHRLILFRLNPEYAALYERLATSSLDIEAPPSNVENGLGIFTGINSDTLYIEVIPQN